MERKHKIKLGDHVVRLAYDQGLGTVDQLWMHPANEALRGQRVDPGVLGKGDEVHVPDPPPRTYEHLSTRRVHRIVVPLPVPTVRVRLERAGGIPFAGRRCTVAFDGQRRDVEIDGDGGVEMVLGPHTERVSLSFESQELDLDVAHLQPIDHEDGWRGRLENLGYGPAADAYGLRLAVEEFQLEHGLDVDGAVGPQTQAALLDAHGA